MCSLPVNLTFYNLCYIYLAEWLFYILSLSSAASLFLPVKTSQRQYEQLISKHVFQWRHNAIVVGKAFYKAAYFKVDKIGLIILVS